MRQYIDEFFSIRGTWYAFTFLYTKFEFGTWYGMFCQLGEKAVYLDKIQKRHLPVPMENVKCCRKA
ncbi:MAG: hypothetical protein A2Y31_01720 [Spirochaetes bacterium GWC2_52_13]|nr:MAG: hypothetical protein A2Y31_01720 [Spirochaetes bacterium GWC2_52_13]OHD62102.1 MAG: hypothetical protein A2101_00800 [Spirochaetes bacterium GWF2_52_7]